MDDRDRVGDDAERAVRYDDFGDARTKHLELIQGVISRLATNSFLIKGWALTSAGVFAGFTVETGNALLGAVSVLLTIAFWGLDTSFLRSERLFRALFDRVRIGDKNYPPFYMSATSPGFVAVARRNDKSWGRVVRRPTLSVFYGSIAVATLLVVLIVWRGVSTGEGMPEPLPSAASSPEATSNPQPPPTGNATDQTPSATSDQAPSPLATGPDGT